MRAWGQVLLLMGVAVACVAGAGLRAQTKENSKGEISGTVLDAGTLQPLKNASVSLQRTATPRAGSRAMVMSVLGRAGFPHSGSVSTSTDAGGKFVFHNVDAGQYQLRVWHNGYVGQGIREGVLSGPGRKIALESGEKLNDLKIRLTPAGVVTGRVTGEDGEPMPWVSVRLLAIHYSSDGVKRASLIEAVTTNDPGQYRVFGLAPGQYYVEANYSAGVYVSAGPGNIPAVTAYPGQFFYPGVTDPTDASEIAVNAGQETGGIDFSLHRSPVYTVSGKLAGASAPSGGSSVSVVATTPPGARRAFVVSGGEYVQLFPQGGSIRLLRPFYALVNGGRFEFKNVPPGSYTLMARKRGPRDGGAMGQLPVSVSANVSGLDVTLQSGFELHGRLSVEGQTGNSSRPNSVFLEPAMNSMQGQGPTPGRVEKDGSFVLNGVFPGSYWLRVIGMPPNDYVRSIRLGRQDGLAKPLDFGQGGTRESLSVAIGSDGARLAGAVVDGDDKPASDATVVLVPNAPLRGASSLYKVTTTDQDGSFSLSGIRPGNYELFAWENAEQNEWFDPAFLKAAETKATAVELSEGQAATMTVHEIQAGGSGAP